MDGLHYDTGKALKVMGTPFFIISYPDLRYIVSNSANNKELVSPLLCREVNDGDILGKTFDEVFVKPEDVFVFKDILNRVGREKKTFRINNAKLTDFRGFNRYYNIVYSPVLDQSGETMHIVGTAMESGFIGGKKEEENPLDGVKNVFRGILESTFSPVIITDDDFKVVACSRVGLEMWELSEAEVIGQKLEKLVRLLKVESKEISFKNVKGMNFFDKINASITTRSGKVKTFIFVCSPVFSSGLSGMVLIGSDITALIEKQERIIENERLALIGQLTSGIAHEIKNPLTVISGFAEVTKSKIEKEAGNKKLKETIIYYQQEIVDNCRSMNRLIIDLLQLARPKKTERVQVNMANSLEKICNSIAPYALQKNVTLVKDLIVADMDILIDPSQIGQVLLNLCNNSIQSMPRGGILTISTGRESGFLVIKVSDTGSGIKPEDLSKLGTPFFTTKAEGTGLGLSVTYSIIREHGGRIEVDSEIGRGTSFRIYLPLNVP